MTDNDHMSQSTEVPTVPLAGGVQLPMIGLGTWKLTGGDVETSVNAALEIGYRHIDTATIYGNEAQLGSALAGTGISREDIFLTTKIRPSDLGRERDTLRRSLEALRTEYLDLWLVHWPQNRSGQRREIWNALRELRDEGLVKAIGVSNYDLGQLDELTKETGETPAINQVEWFPSKYDPAVLAGHQERGVVLEGYSPLLDPALGGPVIETVARAHGVTPAQVVLRWHLEHGIPVIPKSRRPERLAENFDLLGFTLTEPEVASLDALGTGG
jgi:2,5-diketo-D-gluconate reductase A